MATNIHDHIAKSIAKDEVKLFNIQANDAARYRKIMRQAGLRNMNDDVTFYFFSIYSETPGFEDMWDKVYADLGWRDKFYWDDEVEVEEEVEEETKTTTKSYGKTLNFSTKIKNKE